MSARNVNLYLDERTYGNLKGLAESQGLRISQLLRLIFGTPAAADDLMSEVQERVRERIREAKEWR